VSLLAADRLYIAMGMPTTGGESYYSAHNERHVSFSLVSQLLNGGAESSLPPEKTSLGSIETGEENSNVKRPFRAVAVETEV
jgi:hypothetical protein